MNSPDEKTQLTDTVRRARRRLLLNQALRESAVAATIALLGPTLLLVIGWNALTWPILGLFVAAGAATAAWRWSRARPEMYRVAQVLDARLATHDQISTAIHFLGSAEPQAIGQRQAAARVAAQFDPEAAFPFVVPRAFYGLASVFLVASGLCALRYFLEKPLRLDRPLSRVILQAIPGLETKQQQARAQEKAAREQAGRKQQALAIETQGSGSRAATKRGEQAPEQGQAASPEAAEKGKKPEDGKDGRGSPEGAEKGDDLGEPPASENDPIQSYEDMLERDAKSGLAKAEGKQGKEGEPKGGQNAGNPEANESNSLLSKLRDAMNNMLSRLQQKAPGSGNLQQKAAAGSPSQGAEQQQGQGEGKNGAGQPQPGGQEAASGSEGAEGAGKDMNAQNAAGKNGGATSDQGARGTSGDGAGKQEGDKNIQDALHAEAMGKLSELYGRRAANVTGEITVETQSGKQTLRTPQSAKQARHSDSGGEISRDEIPLAYQAYVKEYFAKLRQSEKK